MYWNVGEYLSTLCANSVFGDKVIDEAAVYIAEANPGVKGFNRRGLYRMKQFYETYRDDEFVTPLVTQISWTNLFRRMCAAVSLIPMCLNFLIYRSSILSVIFARLSRAT